MRGTYIQTNLLNSGGGDVHTNKPTKFRRGDVHTNEPTKFIGGTYIQTNPLNTKGGMYMCGHTNEPNKAHTDRQTDTQKYM